MADRDDWPREVVPLPPPALQDQFHPSEEDLEQWILGVVHGMWSRGVIPVLGEWSEMAGKEIHPPSGKRLH